MPENVGHPDDAFSQVSYAGGMFFLKFLEDRFGREAFDEFLRKYFEEFAFQSIVTEDFLAYFEDKLWASDPDAVTKREIVAWVYEPGLPKTVEKPKSDAFRRVSKVQDDWLDGDVAAGDIETEAWSTHEWLHFVNTLPDDLTTDQFAELDDAFALTGAQNAEIANAWFLQGINGGYAPIDDALEAFLIRVGRGKFIYRLYQTLVDNDRLDWAQGVYDQARPGYHPIAQARIDAIFEEAGGSGAPGDEKSIEEMRDESRAEIDEEACAAQGGTVRQEGLLGLWRCVVPYSDAGASCSDASDCEGRCFGSDDVTDYDAEPGEAVGVCEADDSPFGCFAIIEGGEITPMLCVD